MESSLIYNFLFYAIVIVYPDGTIESVPVRMNISSHLGYFKYLKENAPLFKEMCGNCSFEDSKCLEIRHTLYNNGCALFINFAIQNVATLTMFDLPGFKVLVPEEFGSIEQIEAFEQIVDNYSANYLSFYTYESNEAIKLTIEEVREKLSSFSNNIRSVA